MNINIWQLFKIAFVSLNKCYNDCMNIFELLTLKKATFYLNDKTTIRQALEKFDAHKFSVVPILSESGEYVTSVSEGDILRYIKNNANFDITLAENVLITNIPHYRPYSAIDVETSFDELYSLALAQNFIPVVDDRKMFIGIVKRKDIFQYLMKMYNEKK